MAPSLFWPLIPVLTLNIEQRLPEDNSRHAKNVMSEVLTPEDCLDATSVLTCTRCQKHLPLRKRQQGEPRTLWLCSTCNVPIVAIGIKELLVSHGNLVSLEDRYFDTRRKSGIGPDLLQQLERYLLEKKPIQGDERRRSVRKEHVRIEAGIELNDLLAPVGLPREMLISDISTEGIGLVHHGYLQSNYIALELSPQPETTVQVIVKIVRQREINSYFYQIGGQFLARLGQRT